MNTQMNEHRESAPINYQAAREQAIRWLGDRYLLAKPMKRRVSAAPMLLQALLWPSAPR
jgi:hypothetical protein